LQKGVWKSHSISTMDELRRELAGRNSWTVLEAPEVIDALKRHGYDGMHMTEFPLSRTVMPEERGSPTVAVWTHGKLTHTDDPNKSFFANRGAAIPTIAAANALSRSQTSFRQRDARQDRR
jgi:hypothetical protein